MQNVVLTITADTVDELRVALAKFTAPEPVPQSVHATVETVMVPPPEVAAGAKRAPGRPRKATEMATVPPAAEAPAAAADAGPATMDGVRAALTKLNDAKGMAACTEMLAKFDATRISQLAVGKWEDFIAACFAAAGAA